MKHYVIFLVLMVQIFVAQAGDFKTIKMEFNKEDFKFSYNENEELVIGYKDASFFNFDDDTLPMLPYFSKMVQIPNNRNFVEISASGDRVVVGENVILAANLLPYPVGEEPVYELKKAEYEKKTYPEAPIGSAEVFSSCGYKLLSFSVCPFEYDAANRTLYLKQSLEIKIKMEECEELPHQGPDNTSEILASLVDDFVPRSNEDGEFANGLQPQTIYNDTGYRPINYLIVTNNYLSSSFEPLRDWKTKKGVRAEIVTMEEIGQIYPQLDPQLGLKTYLDSCYRNHDLEYVLLGGDINIVPVRGCYGKVKRSNNTYEIDSLIPTDLYYACFDGAFDWNNNGDSVYGRPNDNINMMPSIYVTRASLLVPREVNSYVNKILYYEQTPTLNGWNNNILTSGSKLWGNVGSISDAEAKGNRIYNEAVAPYWNGNRIKYYDRHHDNFNGEYLLDCDNLSEELSNGYTFVEMLTHGDITRWQFYYGDSFYDGNAINIENDIPTIITTTACLTNRFDIPLHTAPSKCLSEAFIRGSSNSVVAYLGSSRFNWDSRGDTLSTSTLYEKSFYYNLFSNRFINKNYGKIVAAAKMDRLNDGTQSSRWVQFALNPMGDPEMPVYTVTPMAQTGINILKGNGYLYINLPDNTRTVCVESLNDNGASYYKVIKSTNNAYKIEGINMDVSVTITKQNCIPYTIDILAASQPDIPIADLPKITSCSPNPTRGMLNIVTNLALPVNNAQIRISNSSGLQVRRIPISNTLMATTDISTFSNGTYYVSLFVDNVLFDTKTIIKQ